MIRSIPVALAMILLPAIASAQAPNAVPAAGKPQAGPDADKIRCHRYTETGSLSKVRRECHTLAEWRQLAEEGRANARNMVDRAISQGGTGGG